MERYNIAILHSSAIIATGVATLLERSSEIGRVTIAVSIDELRQQIARERYDVVVAAIEECATLESGMELDIPIVAIQQSIMPSSALRHIKHLVTIYTEEEELIRTVREAIDAPMEMTSNDSHELSERERDVLILVARGLTNKEIASELNISPHTVISHRKNIVHKTGIRSVAGLTVYAVLNKLIDSEQL